MMSVFMFYTEDAESELICEHHNIIVRAQKFQM